MINFSNLKNVTYTESITLNGIKAEHELAKSDFSLAIETTVLLSWQVFNAVKYIHPQERSLVKQVAGLLVKAGYAYPCDMGRGNGKYAKTEAWKGVSDGYHLNESEAMSLLNNNVKTLKSIAKKARKRYEDGLTWTKNYVVDYEAVKEKLLAREDVQNILKNN